MLSSVVNALTYRVPSTCFFYMAVTFVQQFIHTFVTKNMTFVDFLVKYDSIVVGAFCIHFWSTFWKKLTVYAVFGSQISKNVYFWGFFGMILYCFVVRLFCVLFRIIYHMFCSFFFFKNHVFSCFSENNNYNDFPFRHCIVHDRMMIVCTSL